MTAPLQHIPTSPIASLRCRSVIVHLAGRDWTIPARPAADWLGVLLAERFDAEEVFPGLLDPADVEKADAWLQEELLWERIDLKAVGTAVLEAITVISGRPWWLTVRLTAVVRGAWTNIGAQLAMSGPDPATAPLGAWLDAAYLTLIRSLAPDRLTEWVSRLNAPPTGEAPVFDEEAESAAFLAAMGGAP